MQSALELTYRSPLGVHCFRQWYADTPLQPVPALPKHDPAWVIRVPRALFDETVARPLEGRFFPTKMLSPARAWPRAVVRVLECTPEELLLDFNHPLAGLETCMERTAAEAPAPAIGAMADAFPWAGMETAFGRPTDFEEADAFVREDEGDDADFYRTPRPVLHVDAHCAARIRSFYASRLRPGDRVLDLMCGWRSHLPEGLGAVVGLGMNEEELRSNPELTEWRAQDLNHEPGLPFASASFDAVVNTVSFEYLVNPSGVLAEARRVLRPGGVLLIALSTRYFPPKVIRLWTRLHPMERLGWVMKHLRQAGCHDVTSLVERGLARDRRDRYAPRLPEMDPLFAVAGIAP